jgi:hypothetical protein
MYAGRVATEQRAQGPYSAAEVLAIVVDGPQLGLVAVYYVSKYEGLMDI